MATYIYCRRKSDSARELVTVLGAKRLREFDGDSFWDKRKRLSLKEGDIVICWGETFPTELDGIRILNGGEALSKFEQARKLQQDGINTIETVSVEDMRSMRRRMTGGLKPVPASWIPRKNSHVGGNDLLTPCENPDYYSARLALTKEYRIHTFLGKKSIRAGEKRLREGYSLDAAEVAASRGRLKLASDWIRSYDGGWRVCYDNFQSTQKMKNLSYKAAKSLGMDFGAVDIGEDATGTLYVLELNRAPGLEGGSIEAYANHIKKWIEEGEERDAANVANTGGTVQPVRAEIPVDPPRPAGPHPTPEQWFWGNGPVPPADNAERRPAPQQINLANYMRQFQEERDTAVRAARQQQRAANAQRRRDAEAALVELNQRILGNNQNPARG